MIVQIFGLLEVAARSDMEEANEFMKQMFFILRPELSECSEVGKILSEHKKISKETQYYVDRKIES